MITVIITSWKEPNTIGKCIQCIGDINYSGIPNNFEILQLSPDKETLDAGLEASKKLKLSPTQYRQIQDPKKGKPYALKLAIKESKGDILIFTDGDTYFDRDAVKYLIEPFENPQVGGVSGKPIPINKKDNLLGYWGHLLYDAADDRRIKTISNKKENYYVSDNSFFPMSGYIMSTRKFEFDIPSEVLSDDAYISYQIKNSGREIAYAPLAKCFVKYPTSLSDYYKQKVRAMGGFIQLEEIGVVPKGKQSRSFGIELKYFFFVFRYAKNIREFIWSVLLFPVRLWTWIRIYWERVVVKKDFQKTWTRIESTK